jgi:sensor histidine kinase YesM
MTYTQREEALGQYAAGIDREIRAMSIIASLLIHNKTIANESIRYVHASPEERYRSFSTVEGVINSYSLLSGELVCFYLCFSGDNDPLISRNNEGITIPDEDRENFIRMAAASQGFVVYPDKLQFIFGNSYEWPVCSLAVSSPAGGEQILIISFVEKQLLDFIRRGTSRFAPGGIYGQGTISGQYSSDSFLIGRNKQVLASSVREMIGKNLDDVRARYQKSFIIMQTELETSGWLLVEAINVYSITRPVNIIFYILIAMLVLLVLFFIQYNSFFFARILTPLTEEIENEQKEHLKSEIEALRYQLNPHFLCNTLNSIRMLAIITKNDAIKKMSGALMTLTEDILTREDTVYTLEHELQNLESYIYIMKIRYGDNFEYITDVEAPLLRFGIPSMMLQPLVENSILHGFHSQGAAVSGANTIVVSASRTGLGLEVSVRDNGRGMTEGIQAGLFAENGNSGKGISRIGLENVRRRIALSYGAPYGVNVYSWPEEGTVVTLALPLLEAEDFKGRNRDA